MPRIKSEMFEKVAEILEGAGLTKEAYPSLDAYKDDPHARVGSDSITDIEALYGVKPDTIKDMEYEQNIMEIAHPNSVVIAPSYDKINGLVENNIERNKIMTNITLTNPTGNHTNHKYAQQELIMELVRIANEMDARNKEELFKLADNCLIDLSACQRQSKISKTALAIIPVAIGIAVVLGAAWLLAHSDNPDQGPVANCTSSINALNNLAETSWYESTVDETVKSETSSLILRIMSFRGVIINFNKVSDLIYQPRTLSELQEVIKLKRVADQNSATIDEAIKKFKAAVLELEPLLIQDIENFSSTVYQKQHTTPSTISNMTGWLGEALHGRWGLIPNDFISAVNALNTLKSSVMDMVTRLENFDKIVAKYEDKVTNAAFQLEEKTGTNPLSEPHGEDDDKDLMGTVNKLTPKGLEFLKHINNR